MKLALGERTPDYLIIQHMEPDHSGSVSAFIKAYPEATVVASEEKTLFSADGFDKFGVMDAFSRKGNACSY